MQILSQWIDGFNSLIGKVISWLLLFMVLVMFVAVVQRYFLEASTIWQLELVRNMHAMVFLAAAAYTLQSDEHVRVDVLYQRFSPKVKAWVNALGVLCCVFPVCIAIMVYSSPFILESWRIMERSAEYEGLPGVFILKSFIWVFALLLVLQGISILLQSIVQWSTTHE